MKRSLLGDFTARKSATNHESSVIKWKGKMFVRFTPFYGTDNHDVLQLPRGFAAQALVLKMQQCYLN